MTNALTRVDKSPFLERGSRFNEVEDSYEITNVTGQLPPWVRGTSYINGPARFERVGFH
jgi:carotenoid cleavage dioxygenase-like enzyme